MYNMYIKIGNLHINPLASSSPTVMLKKTHIICALSPPHEASAGWCSKSRATVQAITTPHGIPASNSCITARSLTF